MISEKSLILNELKRMCQNSVNRFCRANHIPNILVRIHELEGRTFASFDWRYSCVWLSTKAPKLLEEHTSYNKVWWLNKTIIHELTHYIQYLRAIKLKRRPLFTEDERDRLEEEADIEGNTFADNIMKRYTEDIINPEQHKLGSRQKNPKSLYEQFHGIPPSKVSSVFYTSPPKKLIKIGRLLELQYHPEAPSKLKNTAYYHVSGDTGTKKLKSNLILATDPAGKNLYLVKDDKSKRPYFSNRGIIG